jgi:hypothetical protein
MKRLCCLILMLALPPAASAQDLCADDAQLRDLATLSFLVAMPVMPMVCQDNHPAIAPRANALLAGLSGSVREPFQAVNARVTAFFEHSVPGHGESAVRTFTRPAISVTAGSAGLYTEEQCAAAFEPLEWLAHADAASRDAWIAEKVDGMLDDARAAIPPCD